MYASIQEFANIKKYIMKTKIILLIGVLICNLNSTFGQICGTPLPTSRTNYNQEDTTYTKSASSALCIDVFFHIVRNTNGTNAFITPNLDAIVNDLNEFYNPHNIIINNSGSDFIDNTNLLVIDTDNGEDNVLFNTQNREGLINFYIVESFVKTGLVGKAQNIPSRNLVMRESDVLTNVSAHELGHCLNLYHTHQPGGDLVTDTPIDPGLGTHNVNDNCEYTGDSEFNPLANNIMSYSRITCLTDFTNGQGYRMRYALQNESVLQNVIGEECVEISELNKVCYGQNYTLFLSKLNGMNVVWETSRDINVISQNDTRIQITANTSRAKDGWVIARIGNSIELTEYFGINKEVIETPMVVNVNRPNSYTLEAWTSGGSRKTPYFWYLNGEYIKSTSGNSTSFPYSYNGVRIEVRNRNSCDTGWNTAFFTGSFRNSRSLTTSHFYVYPNPSRGVFFIGFKDFDKYKTLYGKESLSALKQFFIYDLSGNLVHEDKFNGNGAKIDISHFRAGNYFLRIEIGNSKKESHQIIIDK